MLVYKVEWSEFLGSYGPATRMMAELCERHADAVFRGIPNACASGKYEAPSCEFCDKEGGR